MDLLIQIYKYIPPIWGKLKKTKKHYNVLTV